MSLLSSRVIFPRESRDFVGKRYISIGLRTLHLMGIAGFAGFFLFALPIEIWRPFAILAVSSGIALIGVEIFSDGIWLLQLRGLAVILKLLILAMCFIDLSETFTTLLSMKCLKESMKRTIPL